MYIKIEGSSTGEHSTYSELLSRARVKERFMKKGYGIKLNTDDTITEGKDFISNKDLKSPAFVIADSPILKSKTSSESKTSNE